MENKHEVRFRDIDPDTGDVSQDMLIAVCETKKYAELVLQALVLADQSDDPNREFYTKQETNTHGK